jgi:signal transduction histidine kinase
MLARLESSVGETEAALEATRRFAADVGHELRTPLTSIRANFGTLERNPELGAEERTATLAELAREQDRLVAMLDSLQALARGDAGKALPMEPVEFASVVDAAVEAARRRHPSAEFEMRHEDGDSARVHGWPDGLRLLVDNLLENAVRHGGRRIGVTLAGDRLVVDDDGPGIPDSERELIFERFFRGGRTRAPGSGLGLALVAQQVGLHGGAIDVSESSSGGARFTIRLRPPGP